MKFLFFLISIYLFASCNDRPEPINSFYQNWVVSPTNGAFKMDDWIVWGGSVIQAEDGKYYMFASRWPKRLTMGAIVDPGLADTWGYTLNGFYNVYMLDSVAA